MTLLRLLWLASPALPVGAYAYSRGLEYAVEAGWVDDEAALYDWVHGVLENQVASLDAPVLARIYDAALAGDDAAVARWDHLLQAMRESKEAALEDRQLGLSLARVLHDAGVSGAARLREHGSYVALFALGGAHFGVGRRDAVLGYLFAFAEGQVTAGSKLMPLGQSAAQRVLQALMARLESLCDRALALEDLELGSYAPGLALASALHETQYARLYRS